MNTNLFVPKKINVGFQERYDTYTKKLAYVIYYDEKGVLRKEKSWQSWRDENIPNQEFDNVPTSGFVLNKHAGGYASGWNHRNSYIRVYDPRDFEFEISVENLLYILENCNSIKGKGLEGEFVYSWNGTELVLLPVDSPDYKEIMHFNDKIINAEKITNKTLVCGRTYRQKKDNLELIYMGRYNYLDWSGNDEGLKYIFAEMKGDTSFFNLHVMSSANGKFIETVSTETPYNFDDMIERLKHNQRLFKKGKKVKRFISLEKSLELAEKTWNYRYSVLYEKNGEERIIESIRSVSNENHGYLNCNMSEIDINQKLKITTEKLNPKNNFWGSNFDSKVETEVISLKEFFEKYNPYTYYEYLENGYLNYIWIDSYKRVFDDFEDLNAEYMKINVEE